MSGEQRIPPSVGTKKEYSEAPFQRRTEWAREGDLVRMTGSGEDHHLATHPDYVEDILFDEQKFRKLEGFESVFGSGVFTVYGDQWQAQRRALNPAFLPKKIRSYGETIGEIARQTATKIGDGETLDARELFTELTVEVMLETLFGGADHRMGTISQSASKITEWFLESSTAGDVPPTVQSEFETGREKLVTLVDEMIDERGDGDPEGDLLSMLIARGEETEAGYTDGRIRDEMITMLFAAHETTALTLTYTFFLLLDAPAVERRLRSELDEVLGGDDPGPQHLDEMTVLDNVVNESLRLLCPAHSLYRETRESVVIDGYRIPEGDVVHLPQWVIHRDERWWEDATEFQPSRFSADRDRPSFAFFPFGAGPRRCIGEGFALAETKIVVATLLDRFDIDRVTETFDLRAGPTAVPDRAIELEFHAHE